MGRTSPPENPDSKSSGTLADFLQFLLRERLVRLVRKQRKNKSSSEKRATAMSGRIKQLTACAGKVRKV